jgi:SpoIID/LytB domain protein
MTRLTRLLTYVVLLGTLALTGARGANGPTTMRVGLQTKQTEVRLQGTGPLTLSVPGAEPVAVPADGVLVFKPADGGVTVTDPDGQTLLTAAGAVQVAPAPVPAPENAEAPAPPPATIRLLGATRHYDGKADRPYRGTMLVQPVGACLTTVNTVDIEEYLQGVVSSEMGAGYPLEALKAQAVAARTYALRAREKNAGQAFDLDDTPACQVYGGVLSEDPRVTLAVRETAGKVLRYDGKLIDAVYSSTCGGYTESAKEAWGRDVPYLQSVADYTEEKSGIAPHPESEEAWATYFRTMKDINCLRPKYANPQAFRWVVLLRRKELEANLGTANGVGTVTGITPVHRGASGRITALKIEGTERTVTIEKELAIRRALGGLRSSAFTLDTYRDDNGVPVVFALWGAGWGHGIGLCQVGAVGLAEQGWTYDKILAYYYKGVTLGE